MKVIVFGSAGGTGRQLVAQALAAGHQEEAMEQVLSATDLEWTVVRVGLLTDDAARGSWRAADDYSIRGMGKIARPMLSGGTIAFHRHRSSTPTKGPGMFSFPKAILTAALVLCAIVAAAQTARIKGTIESVAGNVLTVKLGDGSESKLVLAPDATIVGVVKASMSEIKEGTFIAGAATAQPDGIQRAFEVRIFPEEMRGVGEGHRPYAAVPQGTMTNGTTVGAMVKGIEGPVITVKYKEGEKKIVVPADAQVLRYVIGSAGDLKPGAHFNVTSANRKPDGSYETNRINVGRDGVAPQ